MHFTKTEKLTGVALVLAVAAILAISFFATTWICMLIGGSIGNMFHIQLLKSMSFWQYSPMWGLIVLAKMVLR